MPLYLEDFMQGKPEGLYLYVRHSADCKFHPAQRDRDQSHRCTCVKYIAGTAPDRKRIRESTSTGSWEKANKMLARLLAEHDPTNRPLFNLVAGSNGKAVAERQTVKEAISQFLEMKRGENIVDMAHYEGLFERELLPWCRERGIL